MNGAVIVWLLAAVVFGVAESATVVLVSIWMAVGAVAAAIAAAFGQNLMVQILIFLVVSAILLVLTAPLSRKFRSKKMESTNADRLIGQEGVVLVSIDAIENKGQVKVLGQIWSVSAADGVAIAQGEKVIVESIEGVRVIVKKKG
ncbi:MAG: NfeD family protein [Clostridia bacterium]|nr:NfeD family protein [Clostridia bacterium]